MRKHLWVIGAAGFAGITLLGFSGVGNSAYASNIPVAGIELTLERYSQSLDLDSSLVVSPELAAEVTAIPVVNTRMLAEKENADARTQEDKVTQVTDDTDGTEETDVQETDIEDDSEEQEKKEINVKDLISNLNYDRLGIAKVDNWLNIRQKPGTDSKVVGKLPKNAGCNVYSIKKGWAKIKSGNVTGYVKSEYLVTDEDAEKLALEVGNLVATVTGTVTLNARFVPSTDSGKYTLFPEGEDLDVYREKVTQKFVDKFIEKNFKGSDKKYIENVNKKEMYKQLDDWICVKIDNEKVFVSKEYVTISYQLKKAVALNEVKEDKAAGITSGRVSMVSYAKNFLGNPYVWGGTSLTNGTDCSGFTQSIYRNFGYYLPRTSGAQANATRSISSGEARPGDLFFYGNGRRVSHVAMYIGNGQVIHASNKRDGIKISNAYYRTPMKIGRFIND